jgi:FtsP/CotA-like multicopper oxidase with cupredoxin domain
MILTRRECLCLAAMAAAGPRMSFAQTGGSVAILEAQRVKETLVTSGGLADELWRFDSVPGATVLRAVQGQEFRCRVVNRLDRDIWFHWFGIRGPSAQMTANVLPGEENAVDFAFTPPDAGTFWFGPMLDASLQREMGLYGVLAVAEAEGPPVPDETVLVLDDWKLTNDGRIEQSFGDLEAAIGGGRLGNWFTINGLFRPHLEIPARRPVRLRILNAANVRTMSLLFKGGDPLLVALDGQPVRPRFLGPSALALAPGQRADMLLPEGDEQTVLALDLFEDMAEIGYLERAGGDTAVALADNFSLSANPLPVPGPVENARTVEFRIEGGAKGQLAEARFRGELRPMRELLEKGMAWAVNGVVGPGDAPFASFVSGETVVIAVDNRTAFEQPLHIHGPVWQQLDGAGHDRQDVWRDTAVIAPGSRMRLVFVAGEAGAWAIQSLVAERVDSGLIAGFLVEAAPGAG